MVAQTATAKVAKPAKSQYRPHIRIVDADRGLYTVQSQMYTYVLYGVDVVNGTCECEAGKQGFRNCKAHGGVCKHIAICRAYHAYRQSPTHVRPIVEQEEIAAAVSWDDLAAEFAALPVPAFDFSAREPIDITSRRKAAPAFVPAPAEFAEIFG